MSPRRPCTTRLPKEEVTRSDIHYNKEIPLLSKIIKCPLFPPPFLLLPFSFLFPFPPDSAALTTVPCCHLLSPWPSGQLSTSTRLSQAYLDFTFRSVLRLLQNFNSLISHCLRISLRFPSDSPQFSFSFALRFLHITLPLPPCHLQFCKMSTLLSSQPLSGRSPVEALLLVYLTTVPAWRASRILETWDSGTQLTTFAETILNNIPLEFFESTLPVPNGPRYVIDNGALSLQLQPSHNLPAIDREYLRSLVRAWRPNHVQAERTPVRTNSLNSFMVFRSELYFSLHIYNNTDKTLQISLVLCFLKFLKWRGRLQLLRCGIPTLSRPIGLF